MPTETLNDFLPAVGDAFDLAGSEPPLSLTLTEATPLPGIGRPDQPREPFSLTFRLSPGAFLPQGTYEMRHATLGDVAIFVVPYAQDADGTLYEASFT